MSGIIIARPFLPSIRAEVVLELGKGPDSFLMLVELGEWFKEFLAQEVEDLHEIGNFKINPGQSSCQKLFVPQNSVKFLQVNLPVFDRFFNSFLEGIIILVFPIHKPDVPGVKILVYAMNGCHQDLLLWISANKFRLFPSVANVNIDGITLTDDFVSIDKVGEGDSRILFHEFRSHLIDELFSALLILIELLSVGHLAVLEEVSASLSKASDSPITKNYTFILHQRYD